MTVDGSEYVPQEGDVLTVARSYAKSGNTIYPAPTKFVAVGFNSFNKEGSTAISQFSEDGGVYTVAVYGVADLENGYTIYDKNSGITAVGIADSATGTVDTTGAVLDAALSYVTPTSEKPYIIVTTTDIDGLCIHPKWSGYRDEDYEDNMEDEVELASYNSTCPLYSVGSARNIWNFNDGKLIKNIGTTAYTSEAVLALIDDGKVIGTDFDFDENYIYFVLGTPVETSAPNEQLYEANDFGVEFFVDANGIIPMKAYGATWYMTNLVDKLRRMEGLVHLDSLSGTGSENAIYECDDHIWYWKDEDGITAEWNDAFVDNYVMGNGLIFAQIPEGQVILEYRNYSNQTWRSLKMVNGVLTCMEGDTVIDTCTVGNKKQFNVNGNNSRWLKVNYQKHYIGFEASSYVCYQNVWNGNVTGGHWGIVDHYNHPYFDAVSNAGILRYNYKGQIIRTDGGVGTRTIRFNSNSGNGGRSDFYTNGTGNGPSQIYVPTTGGTQGQILQSNGNAEPTWINWIKAVKITSDAYDALVQAGTTDPYTLYLIDDE